MAVNGAWRTSMIKHVIVMIFLVLPVGYAWSDANKITVVTEEWAPYNYSENGELKGFSVEIIQAIAKKLNANVDIQLLPSMRATAMLNSNPRTMLITMLRTPEREKKYKWVGPLGDSSIYFYKKKGSPVVVSTLADVKKVGSICTRQGGLVFSTLKSAGFVNLNASANEGEAIYNMLIHGRCDLAISDSPLGVNYLLKKMNDPPDAVVQTSVKLVAFPIYIACSQDIPDAEIARWQKALDFLKVSGAFHSILEKYDSEVLSVRP
jgi:polar amino acid transport system substrate-binding protein